MKRRKFLMASLASVTSPMMFAKSDKLKKNMNNPVILSTWNFGMPANVEAMRILDNGGNAMDAAEAGARNAESDIENNSVGLGGLPDELGYVTLDACVMDSTGNAGSVAFLQDIKHPVSVARMVMEETKHVMLVGEGAKEFAKSKGFEEVNLLTEKSENEWKKWLKERREMTPHETHDTLSVLVQDKEGNLAGACTTSGWAYKMHGRVGDSPIIGAALFVDNEVGSAAATGLGEEVNLLTEKSENEWKKWLKEKREMTPHETHDTLSVLVQDKKGNLAGACTTSGWAYKMHGRVGDSPIIGAALFVDNEVGSAAATGLGEEVIKSTGSFLVVELMRQGYSPNEACEEALNRVIKAHGGNPDFQIGYIALRKDGEVGAACLKWSFDHAIYKNGINKLHNVKGMM